MKNLYDRFFPLMDVDGKPRFGTKKLVTVWAQSMDDVKTYDSYYEYTAAMYPSFGFEWVDNIVCPNANDPESADRDAELKIRAYEAGALRWRRGGLRSGRAPAGGRGWSAPRPGPGARAPRWRRRRARRP